MESQFIFESLSKKKMIDHIDDILLLSNQSFGSKAWDKGQFFTDLPLKWELSSFASYRKSFVGYIIFSTYLFEDMVYAHAHSMAIFNQYRGMGLAPLLLTFSQNLCSSNNIFTITTEITTGLSTPHIVGVIEKLGFVKVVNKTNIEDYLAAKGKTNMLNSYIDGSNSVFVRQLR